MSQDNFSELLAVDEKRTLEFFVIGLTDVSEPPVDKEELLYNASVLAHYAQVSTQATPEFPAPRHLSDVFERFVLPNSLHGDVSMMETAGAQCLLLSGFFEDQSRRRHNVRWYAQLGAGFFGRAAVNQSSPIKAKLMGVMAGRFELWRRRHARLSRELRDQRFLLQPPQPPS